MVLFDCERIGSFSDPTTARCCGCDDDAFQNIREDSAIVLSLEDNYIPRCRITIPVAPFSKDKLTCGAYARTSLVLTPLVFRILRKDHSIANDTKS